MHHADGLLPFRSVVVSVPGLTSRSDLRCISRYVSDVAGVAALLVDVDRRTVTVHGHVTDEAVKGAVAAAGYAITPGRT